MPSVSDDELGLDVELRATAETLRGITAADRTMETPPESIWDAIQDDLAANTRGFHGAPRKEATAPDSDVVDLSQRRERHSGAAVRWLGLAAAAVVVVAVGIGIVLAVGNDDAEEVLARADLARLDDHEVIGEADLVESSDALRLDVELPGDVDPGDGFFELWLINDDVTELISLGPLPPDNILTTRLPDTIDPESFPIVDVSFEALDGDTTHSGNSLARGRLSA